MASEPEQNDLTEVAAATPETPVVEASADTVEPAELTEPEVPAETPAPTVESSDTRSPEPETAADTVEPAELPGPTAEVSDAGQPEDVPVPRKRMSGEQAQAFLRQQRRQQRLADKGY